MRASGSSALPASITSASAPARAAKSSLFISSQLGCLPCMRVRTRCQRPEQLPAGHLELEMALLEALVEVADGLPGAVVPDVDVPAAVLTLRECRPRTSRRRSGGLRLRPPDACPPGSSEGPLGTAQLRSVPSHSSRKSQCRRRAACFCTTKMSFLPLAALRALCEGSAVFLKSRLAT